MFIRQKIYFHGEGDAWSAMVEKSQDLDSEWVGCNQKQAVFLLWKTQ